VLVKHVTPDSRRRWARSRRVMVLTDFMVPVLHKCSPLRSGKIPSFAIGHRNPTGPAGHPTPDLLAAHGLALRMCLCESADSPPFVGLPRELRTCL
jgi:hypothetical protein